MGENISQKMNHNVAVASAAVSVILITELFKKKKKKIETKKAIVDIAIIQKLVVEYMSFIRCDVLKIHTRVLQPGGR